MIKFIAKTLVVAIVFGSMFYIVYPKVYPKYYFSRTGHYMAVCNKVTGECKVVNVFTNNQVIPKRFR